MTSPLADMMRPSTLSQFVGQEKLVGKEGIIRKLLLVQKKTKNKTGFPSLILWGPPGSGKTTLARIIARELNRPFYEFSAVSTSVKDIENVIENHDSRFKNQGQEELIHQSKFVNHKSPVIFIDEIHRFNKAQQDRLLPHVENGAMVLIGATTQNPSFEVIGPLLSRTRVLTLYQHSYAELSKIVSKALLKLGVKIDKKARKFLIDSSNGDARALLNVLEIATSLTDKTLCLTDIENASQRQYLAFDKKGEEHYNVISAFIKSMRASNADAALYYLARMVEAGQDPLYIARRMVVFASEDIGMALPTALVVANEVFRACETIGYPECAINLAHGVVYLSKAKKDRKSYDALRSAQEDVRKYGNLPVPMKIRNAPTDLMKELGYGKDEDPSNKSLLPEKLSGKTYFPKDE